MHVCVSGSIKRTTQCTLHNFCTSTQNEWKGVVIRISTRHIIFTVAKMLWVVFMMLKRKPIGYVAKITAYMSGPGPLEPIKLPELLPQFYYVCVICGKAGHCWAARLPHHVATLLIGFICNSDSQEHWPLFLASVTLLNAIIGWCQLYLCLPACVLGEVSVGVGECICWHECHWNCQLFVVFVAYATKSRVRYANKYVCVC